MATSVLAGLCSPKVQSTRSQSAVVASFSPVHAFSHANKQLNHVPALHSTRNTPRLVAKRPQLHAQWSNLHSLPEATRRTPSTFIPHSLPAENTGGDTGDKVNSTALSISSSSSSESDYEETLNKQTETPLNSSVGSSDETSSSSSTEVKLDLNLPRRSRLITFTCNLCSGRTERLVNPLAWDKGLVIVQCQHCEKWHKVADAANLVEEIRYADLEDE